MNQKHCRGCPHLDFNEMSDEMYCKLKDCELIRLRWHKQRPDWCPLVMQRGEKIVNRLRNDPEAEWVEIVRCKDCKYLQKWRSEEPAMKFGQIYECGKGVLMDPVPEDFCSRSKKKDGER